MALDKNDIFHNFNYHRLFLIILLYKKCKIMNLSHYNWVPDIRYFFFHNAI